MWRWICLNRFGRDKYCAAGERDATKGVQGVRTRFRASSQAFFRSVGFTLLILMVSRSSGDTGMLRGPGGFSGDAELPRRELVAGADGSGESPFAGFFCGMVR